MVVVVVGSTGVVVSTEVAPRGIASKHGPAQMRGPVLQWHGYTKIMVVGRRVQGGAGCITPFNLVKHVHGVVRHVSQAASPSFFSQVDAAAGTTDIAGIVGCAGAWR